MTQNRIQESSVGIIQEHFGGGRARVVIAMVELLNKWGVVPDIYTFTKIDQELIKERFGKEVDFKTVEVRDYIGRRFGAYKTAYLNYLVRKNENQYDLLFNSGDSLLFLPRNTPTINYVHFPDLGELKEKARGSVLKRLYYLPLSVMYRASDLSRTTIVANSGYTKDHIENCFGKDNIKEVKVIYPPVDIDKFWSESLHRRDWVTTIGRFGKGDLEGEGGGQLTQIEIARELPQLTFKIVGGVSTKQSERYYNRCESYIRNKDINNVDLKPNLPFDELRKVLAKSKYFLHTRPHEHFGISTVEAIAAGAIPVVPNSGGQKEIVTDRSFRFDDKMKAMKILKNLKESPLAELRKVLQDQILRFRSDEFKRQIAQLVRSVDREVESTS